MNRCWKRGNGVCDVGMGLQVLGHSLIGIRIARERCSLSNLMIVVLRSWVMTAVVDLREVEMLGSVACGSILASWEDRWLIVKRAFLSLLVLDM